MTTPKILVITTTAGAGHNNAAKALVKAFESLKRPKPEVRVQNFEPLLLDALDFTNRFFKWAYPTTYIKMAQYSPKLWGIIYRQSDKEAKRSEKLRLLISRFLGRRLVRFVINFDPAVIVCTHFLGSEILSKAKLTGKVKAPLVEIITDFYAHHFWVSKVVDMYVVPSKYTQQKLHEKGVPLEKIKILGIPVDFRFGERHNRDVLKEKLGFPLNYPIILVLGGAFGTTKIDEIIIHLGEALPKTQIVLTVGKNQKLQRKMAKIIEERKLRVKLLGYVPNLDEIMEVADLLISKAGGITVSEALCKNLPMIIVEPIPGQETGNTKFLVRSGAALRLSHKEGIVQMVQRVLHNKNKLAEMREKAALVAMPNAAKDIAELSLRLRNLNETTNLYGITQKK
ncbi:MAG: glycosyltransferase [Candidatus Edwardsbacteria bacterium]